MDATAGCPGHPSREAPGPRPWDGSGDRLVDPRERFHMLSVAHVLFGAGPRTDPPIQRRTGKWRASRPGRHPPTGRATRADKAEERSEHSGIGTVELRRGTCGSMIPIIGGLHRRHSVTILLHSRSLVNKSVIKILRTHRFARQIRGDELSVEETFPFLEALTNLDLRPSKIDLGLLVTAYHAHGGGARSPPSSSRRASSTWSVVPDEPPRAAPPGCRPLRIRAYRSTRDATPHREGRFG